MDITIREETDLLRLVVAGRLDGTTAAEFESAALPLAGRGLPLGLDCTGLIYISSAGIRSILALARRAKAAGVAFSIIGMMGGVRETFLHSGFGSLVALVE
jgi:anti-anti-sigma factor